MARTGPAQHRPGQPNTRTAGPDSPQTGPDRPGQRFVLDSIPVLNNNQSLCWLRIHSLGFSSWVFTPQGLLLRAFRLRPKVRAACVPWGLGLRPKVPGFTLHSLRSSSSGKGGPDRPGQSGAEKHFLLDSLLRVWENVARTGPAQHKTGQPIPRTGPDKGSC